MNLPGLLARLPPRTRLYVATALYGLAGGLVAVAFHTCIHQIYGHTLESWAESSPETFIWRSLALMLVTSLIAGWLVNKRCPEAAGSGIPQLKLAFWKEFGWTSPRIVWVKFLAGVLSIGGGMSLGREGPSVQLAGAISSGVATRLGLAKMKHRMPAVAGAAAGLAAAFNTPLAAVTFVLEEIIGDLNSRFLGNILMASVVGALVAHGLLGAEPAFNMNIPDEAGWAVYLVTPWVAACATFAGLLFQKSSLAVRSWSRTQRTIPAWTMPAMAALLTWGIGVIVWKTTGHLGVFSLGYADLSDALSGRIGWQIAALLLLTKLVATVVCYGLGGCGGIFSPTLFFGGMAGLAAAGIAGLVLPLQGADMTVLAVVGMCACLGAVVRAPVTGILIVFEMTREFSLVLPLMLGTLASQSISRRLVHSNFYEAVLEQDGHVLTRIIPPRDLETWQQLPVSSIANFYPVCVPDSETTTLQAIFDQHPYANFPLLNHGEVVGVLSRTSIERSLLSGTAPVVESAITIDPTESIRNTQTQMIESNVGMLLLCDDRRKLLGVVTLHDLLRAQMAYGKGVD